MSSVKQETLSGIKWSAIERFSLQGIQFVMGIIMARLLMPSDYGIIGMLAIFIAVAQTFIDSGFSSALIRKKDRTQADSSTIFYFNIAASIVCYLVLFFIAPYVAVFFKTPILTVILRVIALNLVINSFGAVQRAYFAINIDFKSQAKATVTSTLVSGACGIVMAYNGWGVWSLVYQQMISAMLNNVLLWVYSNWRPSLVFSFSSFKELGSFGIKLLAASLLHTLYSNIVTLVIGRRYSAKDLGYYSRGDQFATLPSNSLMGILQAVTFPILSKIQDDEAKLLSIYRKYIRVTSCVIVFVMCLVVCVARPLILLLLSPKWEPSVLYLQILCFAVMFDHITGINMNLLKVKGRSDYVLKTEIVKKVIGFCIVMASIPFGVVMICLSRVVYTQIAIMLSCYYTGKLYGLSYRKQMHDFLPYFIKSVISILPGLLLCEFVDSPWVTLPLALILSATFYYALVHKDDEFHEIKTLVLSKLPHRQHFSKR